MAAPDWVRKRFDVSRETVERLEAHANLLAKWSPRINLVSAGDLPDVWNRHIADSLQMWRHAPDGIGQWVDLGSGGGFPGLVIAAVAAEKSPATRVHLVESDTRKATFLSTAIREMGLSASVHPGRIENVDLPPADVISARALASLPRLLSYAARIAADGCICLFPKGARVDSELTEARRDWHIQAVVLDSETSDDGVILKIGDFHRVDPGNR